MIYDLHWDVLDNCEESHFTWYSAVVLCVSYLDLLISENVDTQEMLSSGILHPDMFTLNTDISSPNSFIV